MFNCINYIQSHHKHKQPRTMTIKLSNLTMTCEAFPMQYEGFCGTQRYYVHYRHGYLTVYQGCVLDFPTTNDLVNGSIQGDDRVSVYTAQVGEEYDGLMDVDELQEAVTSLME